MVGFNNGLWIYYLPWSFPLSLPPILPSFLAQSILRSLPPSPLSLGRPYPVPSLPRSFPSSTLPPSTLSSSTDALSLHNIIPASLPPSLIPSLPIPPSLPPSSSFLLPTLHPSSLLPCHLPVWLSTAAQFLVGLHRVCVCVGELHWLLFRESPAMNGAETMAWSRHQQVARGYLGNGPPPRSRFWRIGRFHGKVSWGVFSYNCTRATKVWL